MRNDSAGICPVCGGDLYTSEDQCKLICDTCFNEYSNITGELLYSENE